MMSLMKWVCLVLIVSLMAACASGVQEAVQAEGETLDDSVVVLEPESEIEEQAEESEPEQEAAEQVEAPVEEDLDLPEQAELVKAIQQALVVADSVHTFLIELMKSERAINRFDFFIAPEEQTQFFEEFEKSIKER